MRLSRRNIAIVLLLSLLVCCAPARAGGSGENLILVVNESSWASMAVANEYIRLRNIPGRNVIYLKDTGGFESIYLETFSDAILKPVLQEIEKRGLVMQADYLVYSSDLPYSVDLKRAASPEILTRMGGAQMAKILTPEASINGMTYFYMHVLGRDLSMLHLEANRYFRRISHGASEPLKLTDEQLVSLREATNLAQQRQFDKAETLLVDLTVAHPRSGDLQYLLACCRAAMGKLDLALIDLAQAVDAGWRNYQRAKDDPALKPLADNPAFALLLERMKAVRPGINVQPTTGFRGMVAWSPTGEPLPPNEGPRYLLSTMLAMTSGRGNSVKEAVECLRRSAAADGSKPQGTIYFMSNNDVRSTTRQWALEPALLALREMGVPVTIEDGVLPEGKNDVAGLLTGTERFNWVKSGSKILPGAICENFTSWGGVMKESGKQTPLSEFIRHGAAGASGTVFEPYAIQAKFPNAFIQMHYAAGASLAEAFYQSVSGPYQLLIVGDPLCQPWAQFPRLTATVNGVESTDDDPATVAGKVLFDVKVDPTGPAAARFEMFVDGQLVGAYSLDQPLELDTTKLRDGWHEVRIVAVSASPVQTRGRVSMPIILNNYFPAMEMKRAKPVETPWEEKAVLSLEAKGAAGIVLLHNSRVLLQVQGDKVDGAQIDPRVLGQGPVTIHPIAAMVTAAGTQDIIHLPPIDLQVLPPVLAPALNNQGKLEKGLKIILANGTAMACAEAKPNWLADAGVRAGEEFAVEAFVTASTDDVYQFQVLANMSVIVEIDGKMMDPLASNRWNYIPAGFKRGLHKVAIRGKSSGAPRLDVRFGGPGTRNLITVAKHAP